MARGKRYRDAVKGFTPDNLYSDDAAIGVVKDMTSCRFDETVDIALKLGLDPRRADQMLRGTVNLPAGTGKTVRVAVFAEGEAATQAREAGADRVGSQDLAEEITSGKVDFDVCIATPEMMRIVGALGRVLGPRGLMPNPKSGTVTSDVTKAVNEFKGGRVGYRTDKFANVHVPIGKTSFTKDDLLKNLRAVVAELRRVKPAAAKGQYMQKVVLSSTMGPGVRVDPNRIEANL